MIRSLRSLALLLAVASILAPIAEAAAADAVTITRKGASYADVRADLEDAIVKEGLKIDYVGNIGAMLQRTGPDVGSNQPIYKNAEFLTFCSAKLSRAMMEADPTNLAQCPYVMFVYERAATINEVVIGYRKLTVTGRGAKALEEINALLDKIAKNASK